MCFNPRPPKRTLCLNVQDVNIKPCLSFNPRPPKRTLCHDQIADGPTLDVFQSTSSEEDVVSAVLMLPVLHPLSFNPRPPKRTLCRY